jgi:AcrR family transcriptional regulator
MAVRSYESPLRRDQLEQTRLRILRAVTDFFAELPGEEMTIPLVARRARVALRTVYRHFPTREALFDAWGDWIDENLELHLHSYPETPAELVEFPLQLYRSYEENASLVRAMLNSKAARDARVRTRRRRKRSFERAMQDLTADLEPNDRRRALAVVYLLVSAPGWQAMRDQWDLDGVEAGKAAAWAVRVLVEELRRNPDSIRDVTKGGTK